MPLYPDIESSVPFITGFLQKQENVDLVAKRCRIVRERLSRFYEANREAVEAIPGIRQMPGVKFLNLPQEKSADEEDFSLEAIETDLANYSATVKVATEQKEKTSADIDMVKAFYFALKQNSSSAEEMLPKVFEIIKEHRKSADGDLGKTRECDRILAQLNNLAPGYLPRGLWDVLPRRVSGPTYNETKDALLQGLTEVYFPQASQVLKNAERTLEHAASELKFAQQKLDFWLSLERVKAAEFFKTHYFTLNAEAHNVDEMREFSANLDELVIVLDALIKTKQLKKDGAIAPAQLMEIIQNHINPASPQIAEYLLREKLENLERLKVDVLRGQHLVDLYCDSFTAAQSIRDNQVQLSFVQYLAVTFSLVRIALSILPGWLSNATLAAVEQYNENNKQLAELEESLKKILPEIQAKSLAKPAEGQNPHYTLIGKLKAAFFAQETTADTTESPQGETTHAPN